MTAVGYRAPISLSWSLNSSIASTGMIVKGFKGTTSLFMGWFGPRGLASVVFTLLVVNELRGSDVDVPVFQVATWTILLSVFLHGITARPLAAAYGRWIRSGDPSAPELRDAPSPRVRRDPAAESPLDASGSPPSRT